MTRTAGRTEREVQDIALADGRLLRVDGTYNLRDVGGYPTHAGGSVAWRTLFRSDSLHRLDSHSVAELAGLGAVAPVVTAFTLALDTPEKMAELAVTSRNLSPIGSRHGDVQTRSGFEPRHRF